MAHIIIVSNRLPFNVTKTNGNLEFHPSTGGVATGLSSYVGSRKSKWIGWPGIASDDLTEQDRQTIVIELAKHNCAPVFLSKRQIDDFYNGYSNSLLWPLFHNLPMDENAKHERWWKAYREVNKAFADVILSVSDSGNTIWVHDYQLLMLPELLRVERPLDHIGLFLHIPFPPVKTFAKLTENKRLLKAMLGADLIGFHTPAYVKDFLDNCERLAIGIPSLGQVILGDRTVRVTDFPMGIDYEKFANANKLPVVKAAVKKYKRRYKGRKLIVAIDRLDISKGLPERLRAYRDFLEQNPKLIGKVVLSMVAAPSRGEVKAYHNLKIRLEKLVVEINNAYGTPKWQPIDYINVSIPFEEVNALFQIADVAFITPLRDGMNLTAKEFVASNRRRGVLILSETAGAAGELYDALLVNPKQPATVVDALQQAFTLPRRELRRRLKSMQRQLASNTVQIWAGNFMQSLQQPVPGTRPRSRGLRGSALKSMMLNYRSATRRLLLLDYDGTLVPFTEAFESARPPKAVLRLLELLAEDKTNEIVLISGRRAAELEAWFGSLRLNFVAEHGAVIKRAGSKSWQTIEHVETQWKKTILPVLEKYAALAPRAAIEIKPHSLVWHYRAVPPYYAQKYGVIIKRVLKPLLKKYGVQLFQGNKILEIKDPRVNKGTAVERWLTRPHDFIFAIGDDYTDEDLFAKLSSVAYTVKVGPGRTVAKYRLKTSAEVIALLKRMSK